MLARYNYLEQRSLRVQKHTFARAREEAHYHGFQQKYAEHVNLKTLADARKWTVLDHWSTN